MKITYDPEADVRRILFSATTIEESDEDKPGIVGMEILDASERMDNPRAMEYAIAALHIN